MPKGLGGFAAAVLAASPTWVLPYLEAPVRSALAGWLVTTLLSSGEDGLSLWDPLTGTRTGYTPQFTPAYHHPTARELVEVSDGRLRRAQYH